MLKEVTMSKQTAVEWLIEQVHSDEYQKAFGQTYISIDIVEQAKAMEKEQMKEINEYESFQEEVCLKCSKLTLVPKYSGS